MEMDSSSIFDILLLENIIYILSYLEYDDIKTARLVCTTFEKVLHEPFVNRSLLYLDYRKQFKLDQSNEKYNIVYTTDKRFKHITFNEYKFDVIPDANVTEFWNLYCDSIETLQMKFCTITEEQLLQLLPRLKNLKSLEVGIPGTLDAAKVIACLISTVESITFTSATISREIIEQIPKDVIPTITQLHLQYIAKDDADNYTFRNSGVFSVLKRLSGTLRAFSYFNMNNDWDMLQCLNEIDLKLESLKVATTTEISDDQFERFTKLMCGLKRFEINATYLRNCHAKMICDNMPNLIMLKYTECDILLNEGIKYAANLKHLQTFGVSDCQNASNKGITEGIAKQLNKTITDLALYGYFSNDTLIAVATNCPNLRSLRLGTILYFSKGLLSLIFDWLRNLEHLHISSLNSESDRDIFEPHEVQEDLIPPPIPRDVDIRCLTKLKSFSISGYGEFPGASLDKLPEIEQLQYVEYSSYNQLSKLNVLEVLKGCTKLKKIAFRNCNSFVQNDEDKGEIRGAYPNKDFVLKISPGNL